MNEKETQSVTMEFDLPHAPAKVWRALTEPELLAKWMMSTDMQLAVGKSFKFKSQPAPNWDGIIDCEMKTIEPEKLLRYTWASLGLETVVTWTLAPTSNGGTHLRLEQSGFPVGGKLPYVEGAKWGWTNMAGKQLPGVLAEMS
jgi:uncharacterized protein YndB with AHSA1/START domain